MKKLLILGALCVFSIMNLQTVQAADVQPDFKQKPKFEKQQDFKFTKDIQNKNKNLKVYKQTKKNPKVSKIKHNEYKKFDKKNNKLAYNHNKRYYPHKNPYQFKHYNKKAKFNPYYRKHNHFAKKPIHKPYNKYSYQPQPRPSYYR